MSAQVEESLIANSGLHFKTINIDLNIDEPLILPNGRTLKYTFLETVDFLDNLKVRFDVCSPRDGNYSPVNYLKANSLVEMLPSGMFMLDEFGVPKMKKDTVLSVIENYPAGDPQLVSINSLSSFRVKNGTDVSLGFDLLLGKWLPMPMYENEVNGQSTGYPNGWCRVRIDALGERDSKGMQTFRLTWAFDTKLANDAIEGTLRPAFLEGSGESKKYSLCNRVDLLFGDFLDIPDEANDTAVSDYLVSILGIDLNADTQHKYKFIAYYIYLINYLRLAGAAPEIILYNKDKEDAIPVDMSIDIGNSRTCAVLFERGDFTKARMLRMCDLSEPWRTYENAFDMRVVFRKADFGGDLTQAKDLFQWPSLVRIGEEAKHLVYASLEGKDGNVMTTNYSSPKRYLWDDRPYDKKWEFMVVEDDPTNLMVNRNIFIEGLTDLIDDDGKVLDKPKELDFFNLGQKTECRYSRGSLMTFVMIEILQQAMCYINSSKFRDMHGYSGSKRYLHNIIITCPTAMPIYEQKVLREAAKNATRLLQNIYPELPEISIIPDPEKLSKTDEDFDTNNKGKWNYDEAFASQLVYLYAELSQRYGGHVDQFFKLKGHYREDVHNYGFEGNALTIGTIDIGAGTTDIMVTAYGQKGMGLLSPIPLFYDSFYSAGDDILHNIIRDVILEGTESEGENLGSIGEALSQRVLRMTPDELLTIPIVAETPSYCETVDDIRNALNEEDAIHMKKHLTQELMHHFFADDSANMSHKDRSCRIDFCTQISHPMSQFFLELLKQKRPTKLYSFDEIFPREKPAAYLLDHFEHHFGFRFESLSWRYNPEQIGGIVRDTMEPLIKALSVVMYAYNCDIIVFSGRPTNLEPLTELVLKYIPVAPNRIVCLNQYRVGRWFPLATEEGYFQESQKAVVAVGAEVGYLASTVGFNGLVLDFSIFSKLMKSTARYIGIYDENLQEVKTPFLTPDSSTATIKGLSVFPCYIGCKQFDAKKYQARPLYAIYNNSNKSQLNIMLERSFYEDIEKITIEDVTDMDGETVPHSAVDLRLQTLAKDGNFWMDKGAFTLKIQEH